MASGRDPVWTDRLVEIWGGPGRAGTGLAVGPYGVLTARHVVDRAVGGMVDVRIVRPGVAPVWTPARIVADDPDWDLAVLAVVDEPGSRPPPDAWTRPATAPPRAALLNDGLYGAGCTAVGFPNAERQYEREGDPHAKAVRQPEQVVGHLLPFGQGKRPVTLNRTLPQQWMPLDALTSTPQDQAGWGGMSGAAVFSSEGLLAGVVSDVEGGHQQRRLYVVPFVKAFRASPALRRALATVGADELIESAEAVRVIHDPPELVPREFHDRREILNDLATRLGGPPTPMVALVGDGGMGRTALLQKLVSRLRAGQLPVQINVFDYLDAHGYRPVNVATIIEDLSQAHPDADVREELAGRLRAARTTWWGRLDLILNRLGTRRVLIAIDNAERLLTGQGDFVDRSLRELVQYLATRPDHGVQLLLVSTTRPRFQVNGFHPDDILVGPGGLDPPYHTDLLRDLRLAGSDHHLRTLCDLADGRPRTLELASGLLADPVNGDLATLLADLRGRSGPRLATYLLDRIVESLHEDEAWVLRALAVFGRPVPPAAIGNLLGRDAREDLERLTQRRFIRVDQPEGRWYLPPDEARRLFEALPCGSVADRRADPPPRTRMGMLHRAADWFAADAAYGDPAGVEDLAALFGEIELRLKGGEHQAAFVRMDSLNALHLQRLGHSDALAPFRLEIEGHLELPYYEVRNLALLSEALLRQEDYAGAMDALRRAARWCGLTENPVGNARLLNIARATVDLDNGRTTEAAKVFRQVLGDSGTEEHPYDVAMAHNNLAQCLMRVGKFDEARAHLDAAHTLIVPVSRAGADLLRAQLVFSRGVLELDADDPSAYETLALAGQRATDAEDPVLAGRCVEAQARVMIGHDDGAARKLADAACLEATRMGNPELTRLASSTLALIHLRNRAPAAAAAAAAVAVEFGRTTRGFGGFVIQGAALCHLRQWDAALDKFRSALMRTSLLLRREKHDYQLHEYEGLALAGMARILGDEDVIDGAVQAFGEARQRTARWPGIVRLCEYRLNAVLVGADDPRMNRIRAAARGSKRRR